MNIEPIKPIPPHEGAKVASFSIGISPCANGNISPTFNWCILSKVSPPIYAYEQPTGMNSPTSGDADAAPVEESTAQPVEPQITVGDLSVMAADQPMEPEVPSEVVSSAIKPVPVPLVDEFDISQRTILAKEGWYDHTGVDPSEEANRWNSPSLAEILKDPIQYPDYLLDGLITKNQNVFVRVQAGVDVTNFALLIGAVVTGGLQLAPFGKAVASETLIAFRGGNWNNIKERLHLISGSPDIKGAHADVLAKLHVSHPEQGKLNPDFLSMAWGQKTFVHSMPAACQVVIFPDAERWLSDKRHDTNDYRHFSWLLRELNKKGVSTLVFYNETKSGRRGLESELLSDGREFSVELTYDAGAPTDLGVGFNVSRTRISEHETTPTYFQFWTAKIDGNITYGWECRDPDDKTSVKQVQISERQQRVEELIGKGMKQKDIASLLGVNSATVSRDAAAVKTKTLDQAAKEIDDEDYCLSMAKVTTLPDARPIIVDDQVW